MRAHGVIAVVVALASSAAADPSKPTKVDIKPFRDDLVVLQDSEGGTYVVRPHKKAAGTVPEVEARIFFGTAGKDLYEQANTGRSADGASWSISTWAPRIPGFRPGSLGFKDGSYSRSCDKESPLTQLTGDKAKAVLDKSTFWTEYMMRRGHMLARDDAGVYYYVDRFAMKYGGKGFRVYVGKKGAMKQLALTDVASDSAGQVFSTKTGDLRLSLRRTETQSPDAPTKTSVVWIKGEKRVELIPLDPEQNTVVIFEELGIYKFLGTMCDNI
jgi:hypothetical protein